VERTGKRQKKGPKNGLKQKGHDGGRDPLIGERSDGEGLGEHAQRDDRKKKKSILNYFRPSELNGDIKGNRALIVLQQISRYMRKKRIRRKH